MAEEDSGVGKHEILDEIDRLGGNALEAGPVVHPEPLHIPLRMLEGLGPRPSGPVSMQTSDRHILEMLPTLILAVLAVLWTLVAFARHDIAAYGFGFALTLTVVVAGWETSPRPPEAG